MWGFPVLSTMMSGLHLVVNLEGTGKTCIYGKCAA